MGISSPIEICLANLNNAITSRDSLFELIKLSHSLIRIVSSLKAATVWLFFLCIPCIQLVLNKFCH